MCTVSLACRPQCINHVTTMTSVYNQYINQCIECNHYRVNDNEKTICCKIIIISISNSVDPCKSKHKTEISIMRFISV